MAHSCNPCGGCSCKAGTWQRPARIARGSGCRSRRTAGAGSPPPRGGYRSAGRPSPRFRLSQRGDPRKRSGKQRSPEKLLHVAMRMLLDGGVGDGDSDTTFTSSYDGRSSSDAGFAYYGGNGGCGEGGTDDGRCWGCARPVLSPMSTASVSPSPRVYQAAPASAVVGPGGGRGRSLLRNG